MVRMSGSNFARYNSKARLALGTRMTGTWGKLERDSTRWGTGMPAGCMWWACKGSCYSSMANTEHESRKSQGQKALNVLRGTAEC